MPRRLLSLVLLAGAPLPLGAAPPDFDRQIAPLLAAHCLDCHGGPGPKGDLDLSRKAGVVGEGGSVVPGKPGESTLWERVAADEMPPKKPLSAADKALLKEWIEAGAAWGGDPIDPFRFTTSARAGYDWWALRPLRRPAPPEIRNPKQTIRNEIDHFVLAKLRDKGLSPSPDADRRTLLRRVAFDLTGLPPSPEEVAAFVSSDAPDAYEKAVDKLLASPHYGERWGRHWLDVVRYGETDGFERNAPRPAAYPYRDWVVAALNADTPYDEFARLQLAGDVLRPADPDAVRASGFLVAGVHNTVLGNDQMRVAARQDELEDLVGAVGQTFLGLTANCARCHDHKFDPVSQADYYRLAAALAGVGHGERTLPNAAATAGLSRAEGELRAIEKDLAAVEEPARRAVLAGGANAGPAAPTPRAAWDFRTGPDDLIGKLHAKPAGGARLTAAGAILDGKTALLRTAPLAADLRAKTLEAWVTLDTLTQRGGGVMTVETPGGEEFDAIVFGEQEAGQWTAGSNNFTRTRSFAGSVEAAAAGPVHVALAFADDGTVTAYRDGKPYGKPYKSNGPGTFKAGAVVVFGCRHGAAGGNKMLAGTVVAARLYDTALTPAAAAASFATGPAVVGDAALDAKLTPDGRAKRAALVERRWKAAADVVSLRARAGEKVYANVPQPPGVTRFLARGDVTRPGAVVAPGGLPAVAGAKAAFDLPADAPDADRRRKLAEWVTAPDNPLFARVIVNRVWHHHFGTGLVETPSDFGFNGGRPSHPKLLDWLAAELQHPAAGGRAWSLKRLHKLIVTSATYRQSSAMRKDALVIDADNRLLWRAKPRRLEGEAVRDSMLATAGLLNRAVGGKWFSDYRERNFNGTAYFDPIDPAGPEFHRRSVYRFTPRGANQGLLDTFDCPDPAAAAPRRGVTTTPLQALSLWNGGFVLRMSEAFAARVAKEAPDDAGKQVTRAWQLAFQRDPTPAERSTAAELVTAHGLRALARSLFNANEFLTVE